MHEEEQIPISETFLDEQFLKLQDDEPWFTNIINFLLGCILSNDISKTRRNRIKNDDKYYIWDESYLWKIGSDQVIKRCVPNDEIHFILTYCHNYAYAGHFGSKITIRKIFDSGFY